MLRNTNTSPRHAGDAPIKIIHGCGDLRLDGSCFIQPHAAVKSSTHLGMHFDWMFRPSKNFSSAASTPRETRTPPFF